MVVVVEQYKRCNILHFSSTKSRRVTRSDLAAEIFFPAEQGFDYGSMIREKHNDVYGRILQLDLWVNDKCLWDAVTGIKTTADKRLLIELSTIRDTYEVRELSNVYRFPTGANRTNALTKKLMLEALMRMMTGNHL